MNKIIISKFLHAKRHRVWQAWTTPEEVMRWWGPKMFSCPAAHIDLRVGGTYLYAMRGHTAPFLGTDHWSGGTFKEIIPYERIVMTTHFADAQGNRIDPPFPSEGFPKEIDVTITFSDEGEGTRITITYSPKSPAEYDAMITAQMREGWNSSLEKFEQVTQGTTVRIERRFTVSAEKVYDAWLDESAAGKWLFATPEGIMKTVSIEPRVGGTLHITEQRNGVDAVHECTFHQLQRPTTIVFHQHAPQFADVRITVSISPAEGACDMMITVEGVLPEYAARTKQGWAMILNSLAAQLGGREIVIRRMINAPQQKVWDAFTTKEALAKWWGPNGFTITTQSFSFTEGGYWYFTMHSPDGTDYPNHIQFTKIDPLHEMRHNHGDGKQTLFTATISLAEMNGRTLVTLQSIFPTEEACRHVIKEYKAVEGGTQTLGRLALYLEEPQ